MTTQPVTHSPPPTFTGELYITNRWLECSVCKATLRPGPTIRNGNEYAHCGCAKAVR